MQTTASVPTDQFPNLLKWLPAGLDLDALARETEAIRRDRNLGDGANLLRLALARGPGGFSLRRSSGWVSLLKIGELSNPGVHYRLKQAVAFLAALVAQLLAAKAPAPGYAGLTARCAWRMAPASANPAAKERIGVSTPFSILAAVDCRTLN